MALIDCPECGGTVSSAAVSCPACGHPILQPAATVPAPPVPQIQQRRVNTGLHLVLTIITLGMWLPIWIGVAIWTNYANRREAEGRSYMSGGKIVGIGFAIWFALMIAITALGAVVGADSEGTAATETTEDTAATTTTIRRPQTYSIDGIRVSQTAFDIYVLAKASGNQFVAATVAQILTDQTASCADYAEMTRNASNLGNPEAKKHIERALRWAPQADRCG